jgi:putative peptidoglycan lipid II flippase
VAEDVAGEDVAGEGVADADVRGRGVTGADVAARGVVGEGAGDAGGAAALVSGAAAAPIVAAPTLAAPTLARSARAVVLAMGLGAGVLVAVAGPVAAVFTVIDAGRSASAGSTALAAMPSGLVAFAPGLVGFGLMALLTRALYVRGRPALAGRWVAAGWLVAALGSLTVLVGGTVSSRRLLVSLGVASTLGMTLAAVGLVLTVRAAWGATALAGLTRSLAASVVGGAAAGLTGAVVAGAVPTSGLAGSLGAGVIAASFTLVVFVVVVAAGDRDSGRLLLSRLRRSQA